MSMAIVALFAFTNTEARGIRMGKVTLSAVTSTLLIAVIPLVNTLVIIGYIYAKWVDWRMTRRLAKKD
jgi:hypothetical protein